MKSAENGVTNYFGGRCAPNIHIVNSCLAGEKAIPIIEEQKRRLVKMINFL
jgi:hypothetical protein